jgi:adenosyl cobinamide kinase/adenosyl cobinamide phosphate guanylyltransferase
VITLFVGGASSGKSAIAERYVVRFPTPITYVATWESFGECDADMVARIALHRARRPASWDILEVGGALPAALRSLPGTALVDSLGTWVAATKNFAADASALVDALQTRAGDAVVVSEEVGLGVHPSTTLGGQFRTALGAVNQAVASAADEAWLVVAGRVVPLATVPW